MKNLTSRKFIVTIVAIATMLTSHDLDTKQKAIVAAIAFAYVLIEGVLDYFGQGLRDRIAAITKDLPSAGALDTNPSDSGIAIPVELQSRPTPVPGEEDAPKTMPGVAPPGGGQ